MIRASAAVAGCCASLVLLASGGVARPAGETPRVRGVLVAPGRVTPAFLAGWKARGASAVVVPLDESTTATAVTSVETLTVTVAPESAPVFVASVSDEEAVAAAPAARPRTAAAKIEPSARTRI